MAADNRRKTIFLSVVGVLFVMLPHLHAVEPRVEVIGGAHARGITVLRATFSSQGEVWRFTLTNSKDGEEFREAGFGRLGVPDLFRSIAYNEGTTTILVPAVGWFGTEISFFGEPGEYWLRWGISFRDQHKPRTAPDQLDREIEPITHEQVIQVRRAKLDDMDFIARLAEPALMRAVYGEDFFERQTGNAVEYYAHSEVRAIGVIGRLLLATREKWVGDTLRVAGPKGDVREAADTLLALAKEIPESSYAPYAAYYAGCCYAATGIEGALADVRQRQARGELQDDLAQGQHRARILSKDQRVRRAYEAFAFAAERGDDYLKPRALYQHGTLRVFAFDFDNAERLLFEANRAAPGETKIQEWTESRKGIPALRKRVAEAQAHSDRTNRP